MIETSTPTRPTLAARTRHFARRAWKMEEAVWVSLYRFIFRRPRVPAGATAIPYHAPVVTIMIVFIALSAVEIPIIDLIAHPWPWVRYPLLIAGIWGVTWMVGLLFGFLTRPHAVGPEGIRVRSGAEIDIDLPWSVVDRVIRSREVVEKAPKIQDGEHGRTLALRMQNETNLLVVLERPVEVSLPTGAETIDAVRFWADDSDAFMSAVRTHIP
ncbi:MAG TPA: hypothetical protein VNT50_11395 [Microbacterium sp.]|uniref:hypothetical protein n=1 Tax=Microbacterium sp. TaxID=51671 RepID=UPI002B513A6A|nr:hypothetical protein [Microbacterium sp.]HWI32088.1 hypothetical protein [Microbacterium sp.]